MGEYTEILLIKALAAAVQFVVGRLLDWLFPQTALAAPGTSA
jgi:hypothetical protein